MWNVVAVMSCAHISPLWRMLVTSELLICLCVCVCMCVCLHMGLENPLSYGHFTSGSQC